MQLRVVKGLKHLDRASRDILYIFAVCGLLVFIIFAAVAFHGRHDGQTIVGTACADVVVQDSHIQYIPMFNGKTTVLMPITVYDGSHVENQCHNIWAKNTPTRTR